MTGAIQQKSEDRKDTQRGKYLTFLLEKEIYGIEIKYVTEIIGLQTITEMPELPQYIRGIINIRGKFIPVIDVRLRFGKPFKEYNDRTCVVIIETNEVSVGLIVDMVSEVLSIADEDIVPPPEINKLINNRYIKGIGKVGKDVKLILDCERFLNSEETEMIINI